MEGAIYWRRNFLEIRRKCPKDILIFGSVAPMNGDLLIYSSKLSFGRMTQISWVIWNIFGLCRAWVTYCVGIWVAIAQIKISI